MDTVLDTALLAAWILQVCASNRPMTPRDVWRELGGGYDLEWPDLVPIPDPLGINAACSMAEEYFVAVSPMRVEVGSWADAPAELYAETEAWLMVRLSLLTPLIPEERYAEAEARLRDLIATSASSAPD